MIKINIQGLKDGEYDIDICETAEKLPGIYEEFFGNVCVTGKMNKVNKRYSFHLQVDCLAKLLCDLTLTEFIQPVSVETNSVYLADTELFHSVNGKVTPISSEQFIHEETKFIDLTEEVVEQLAVSLPMKRVSPEAEGKEIHELFPELTISADAEKEEKYDERWAPLKKLKSN